MASGVVGNLVAEKAIPYRWIYLDLLYLTLGLVSWLVTFTIPRNKKLSNWVKSVIFRTPEVNEQPPKRRGKYRNRRKREVG